MVHPVRTRLEEQIKDTQNRMEKVKGDIIKMQTSAEGEPVGA